jgi:hypothetical protein
LGTLKLPKQKSYEYLPFFCIESRVHGAVVGGNFSLIGENIQALLKIGENERRSTVASLLKG